MIRYLLPLALCLLEGWAQSSQSSLWTRYANGDDILAVATRGQIAWVGTQGGGLVRLDLATGQARFYHTDNSDLLDNTVTHVQVDAEGRAWVVTRFGSLQRFDGTTWASISFFEPVRNFLILRSGEVAACREGKIQIYDGTWRPVDTLRQGENHCELAQGPGYELWVSHSNIPTGTGGLLNSMVLTRYDVRTWSPTLRLGPNHPQLKYMQPLVGLLPDADGTLWAGSGAALLHFGDSLLAAPESPGEGGDITSVLRGGDGAMWVGTTRGLARRMGTQWTVFSSYLSQLHSDRIRTLARHGDRLLVGTDSGLVSFTPEEWRRLPTSSTLLPSNYLNTLFTDPAGDTWMGTLEGTVRRRDTAWSLVREGSASRPPDDVTQFLSARDGSLWMATREEGVIRLRNGAWTRFPLLDGIDPPTFFGKRMAEDGRGRIWIALDDKLARFDGTRWTAFTLQELGLDFTWVHTLVADGAGALWAAGDGLAGFDGTAWKVVNRNGAGDLAWEPLEGRLYGLGPAGLARLEGESWQALPLAKPVPPDEYQVQGLTADGRGRVWFAYSDIGFSGLGWTEGDSLHLYPDLPPFLPTFLGFDKDGRLWIGSEEGLAMRNGGVPLGLPSRDGGGRRAGRSRLGLSPGHRPGDIGYDIAGRYSSRKRNALRAEKVYFR